MNASIRPTARPRATLLLLTCVMASCTKPERGQDATVHLNECELCVQQIMPRFEEMVAGARTTKAELAQFVDVEDDLGVAYAVLPEDEYFAYQESDYDTTASLLARRVQVAVGDEANGARWVLAQRDQRCIVRVPALGMTLIVTERPRCLIVDFIHRGTSLLQSR